MSAHTKSGETRKQTEGPSSALWPPPSPLCAEPWHSGLTSSPQRQKYLRRHQDQPSSFWSQPCGSSEDNIPSSVLEGVKMSHCLPCTCRHLWGTSLLLSHLVVPDFLATPRTAARQASLSITLSITLTRSWANVWIKIFYSVQLRFSPGHRTSQFCTSL